MRQIIEKEQGLGPHSVMCQHLAVGQIRRGPCRRLERMVSEVGHKKECGAREGKKVLAKDESDQFL